MKKILFKNESDKLIASIFGDIVVLTEVKDGKTTRDISLTTDDVKELNSFVNGEPS